MFTGIVQAVGSVVNSQPSPDGLGLVVHLGSLQTDRIQLGDSIAVNGTCLTVTRIENSHASFDVSSETLEKCLIGKWIVGDKVNLELALTLQTPIGGHLVSGHVDGIAELVIREPGADCTRLQFLTTQDIGKFIATKGSITVDGVSLTTNIVSDDDNQNTIFEVMLVPHTLSNTTLGGLISGACVHLEIDLVARYLQRLLEVEKG